MEILQEVARRIEAVSDSNERDNLIASTAVLSGLVLDKDIIRRVLRQDTVKESVIYQEILAEGRAEGRAEGEMAKARAIALNLLQMGLSVDRIAQATGLSEAQVRSLVSVPLS
ncbi:MAG: Rpn family recombination-promoting nuclease/putative transposase [Coleofasciculaceae cyanobacterium SM2_3_26]|nr:Rpn family recombination-promoting nuclease/putative transposase [Coleofasciculaceae cyanobacterium SM2_3_26]